MMESKLAAAYMFLVATVSELPAKHSIYEYGLLGISLGALGWFTVWSEKRRDKRDENNRALLELQHNDLVATLKRSEARYEEIVKHCLDTNKTNN
jgi:hypothetical protein